MKPETVLVVLGIRMNPENPMPATVTQFPKMKRPPVYQHLSPDQLEAMDGDQTALWDAEFIDGHYWLETRVPNGPPQDALMARFRAAKLVIDESEIPF